MERGIHHASITVSDMDRSVAFYRDLLGLEATWSSEAAGVRLEGPVADAVTNCPGTRQRIVFMRLGDDLVELVEYTPTGKEQAENKASDSGTMHICFRTDDIEDLYRRLAASGVRLHCSPQDVVGTQVFYFRGPDGEILEAMAGEPAF